MRGLGPRPVQGLRPYAPDGRYPKGDHKRERNLRG
jgi:hypothetical protein